MYSLAPEIEQIRADWTTDEQQIFDKLTRIACAVNPAIQNAVRWKRPTFTLCDNWHHWLFSIDKTKKGITLSFHKGWLLADPQRVLTGDGEHLRMMRFKSPADVDETAVADLMREAISHQTDME